MFVAKVLCLCGAWVRVRVEGNKNDRHCWRCNNQVKAERVGGKIQGFVMPFMTFEWQSTRVDVDADESNIRKPKKKKGMKRW